MRDVSVKQHAGDFSDSQTDVVVGRWIRENL